jgi:hypothetical protein
LTPSAVTRSDLSAVWFVRTLHLEKGGDVGMQSRRLL